MKKLLLLISFFSISFLLRAQIKIDGTVIDASSKEPLVGANIKIKNTSVGTITDINGNFILEKPDQQLIILQISFVGFDTKEIEISGNSTLQIELKSNYNLQEIVINAIRGNKNVPVSAYTFEKSRIDKMQVGQDAQFILEELSPSIISYSESGTNVSNYGQMRLRGIDQTRINITLDGAPLNDMIDQGVFFSNFIDFSNSMQSVQVQRGVGTSTNGTASYAGSINFESLDLRNAPQEVGLQFTAGSFGTLRASAEVQTGLLKNNTAFYTRFTKMNADGYRYNTSTNAYSFFFSGGYYGDKNLIKLTGFTGQSRNGLAYMPVAISDINLDPKTNYVNENDIDDFGQDFVQLQYTRLINKNSSWVSSVYYGAAGGDFPATFPVTDSIYSSSQPDNYYLQERLMQINYPLFNHHYGFTSYYNVNSTDNRLNVNTGIHLYTFKRINLESVMPDDANPYYEEHSRKNEISLFAKADYSIGKLSVYGDIQLRGLSLEIEPDKYLLPDQPVIKKNYTFINPKIGITYQFNAFNSLYALYGYSGREPTKVDLLGGFQLNQYNLENVLSDEVLPEFVNDFEAGFRFNKTVLTGQVNLFYMRFSNEIAPIGTYVPEGFIQLRKNIPSSYRAGIEFDWLWKISPVFTFTGNFTYMDSKIDEYDPEEDPNTYENVTQPLSPKFMGNGSFTYNYRNIFDFELGGKLMSESFLEPTNQPELVMPGFFIMNARFGFKILKEHSIDFYMNNLLDEQYFTYGAPVDPQYDGSLEPGYFVQAPRSYFATLKLKF